MTQPKRRRRRLCLLTACMAALLTSACTTTGNLEDKYGIDVKRRGYVPARIALVPCLVWPKSATQINHLPSINRPEDETKALCEDFEKYVTDGFDNQPYMKGLSPSLVERMYAAVSSPPDILAAITAEWTLNASDCKECRSLPSLYNTSIKNRQSWQIWLTKLSSATKGADALMIPLVLSSNTRIENDRGILQSVRSGAVAILLIDTNDGSLIWSGGRQAEDIYKAFANKTSAKDIKEPPMDDLMRRLLTDAVWIDFPGRQIYR